ncbi:methionine ABC transporter ATP-binding protein [Piscirickettsia salmonis]|uniref:Cell division ATP-binding protein FtsE n=1 Tax=Piscirickettsia salmonis TaxID=1238 RepID=A0A9Q6PUU3_PISSA|nr:ATP-binding cassette domain-containing protein [Piscirickettsia salmonis]ALA26296.1 methionine import ATP-binding protein MetN [Piscirickettsia salmonis]APS43730.1 methionine ABC transporter ATP-binding protein [Piscirickettsia salmonis]APS47085.1 methionine ABC transporter ATP-binding protein [Piscirickettsia salmonis]APS51471.1 methionine ABC transporter ATP-binding protein [Piscirickettsia salmonis]APS54683.1 methionine ABC transporter ATP-binding protein [Piscirickettsia salmonis]
MIRLNSVSKYYSLAGGQVTALNDISLHIEQGSIVGIVGRSGAGKSTLIRMLNILETPSQGEVTIDGVCLNTLNRKELRAQRRQIGMVFQHFNLLASRTVFSNIAFPLEISHISHEQINKKVNELLKLVGLTDKATQWPSQLSGGQKQRVAIARALAVEPKVLLCDEATSALDPESTGSILKLLEKINDKLAVTIVLITHEMDVVKSICQRVAVLDHGCLVEENSVHGLFSEPKSTAGQELVNHSLNLNLPREIKAIICHDNRENYSPLVRLAFVGQQATYPVISVLAEKFALKVNILEAHLDMLAGSQVGIMLCQLDGDDAAVSASIDYLRTHQITVEVLGYVPSHTTAIV